MAQAAEVTGYTHDDAWDADWLRVDETHELYYEQYGKQDGKAPYSKAVIYLHGGPGGHTTKNNTAFFDPEHYRVVLLDQRGCGHSRPNASTVNNTTWHLVSDIEALREHLGIKKWHVVFGGSWGSTLALAYAQTHPSSVGSLVLRGIFAVRELELKWTMTPGGASTLFPDHFDEFINFLPEEERADHVASYHKRLMSDDESISHPAARAWNKWEVSISTLYPNIKGLAQLDDASYNLAHARTEAHYFDNKAWLEEGQLLKKENIDKIRHIPTTIVQGRYDVVCPPITAWELHKAFPESKLHWVSDAGHSATEPGTKKKLIETCDAYVSLSV
ncbi:proline iminopeptidase [Lizonia empirigonia]|nr:proline iminopeptidase [Lizonia empirigonia]